MDNSRIVRVVNHAFTVGARLLLNRLLAFVHSHFNLAGHSSRTRFLGTAILVFNLSHTAGHLNIIFLVKVFSLEVLNVLSGATRYIIDFLHIPFRILQESINVLTENLLKITFLCFLLYLLLFLDGIVTLNTV